MAQTTIFRDIEELITLQGANAKQGRRVTEPDLGLVAKGAIVSRGGKIVWVGATRDLKKMWAQKKVKAREISLKGTTVLPAFVECHTHMVFAGSRAHEFEWRQQGLSYQEIAKRGGGILHTVRETRYAFESELLADAEKRAREFLRQGVTTVEIKSGYGLDAKSEIKMLTVAKKLKCIRTVGTFLGPHAIAPEFSSSDAYLNFLLSELLPVIAKKKLAERVDIFVEENYFTPAQAKKYFAAAQKLGLRVTIHADQLTNGGGAALAAEFKADSADHLVQIQEREIKALANSNVTCVLLPAADFYLKMAYPPARALIDAGARVALATDFNPGTSPTQDLSLVGVLARLNMKMTLPEIIAAYTVGAAHALNRGESLGSIDVKKYSDFICLEGSWRDLFYQVGRHPVRRVFKNGQEIRLQEKKS